MNELIHNVEMTLTEPLKMPTILDGFVILFLCLSVISLGCGLYWLVEFIYTFIDKGGK